jgi:hypothetical protein
VRISSSMSPILYILLPPSSSKTSPPLPLLQNTNPPITPHILVPPQQVNHILVQNHFLHLLLYVPSFLRHFLMKIYLLRDSVPTFYFTLPPPSPQSL